MKDPAAVAGSSASRGDIEWVWGQGKTETMHPFWAVRRITQEQLDKEVQACNKRNKTAVAEDWKAPPNFNCELVEKCQSLSIATVGASV